MQTQPVHAATQTSPSASQLHALLAEQQPNARAIGDVLDRLAQPDRIAAVRSLSGREQKRLWRAVEGARPLALTDLVSADVPALMPVRHYGKNSLPAFSLFEKRFYRPEHEDPRAPVELCGANFQTLSPLTGPGYFVVRAHASRPELDVDYRRVPDRAPSDWPAIVRNDRGVSRLVYGFMVDTLRRVSEHVTIGSAARNGKDMNSYFVLCREELPR